MSDWIKKAVEESADALAEIADKTAAMPEAKIYGEVLGRVARLDAALTEELVIAAGNLVAEQLKAAYMAGVKHGVELEREKRSPRKPAPPPRGKVN